MRKLINKILFYFGYIPQNKWDTSHNKNEFKSYQESYNDALRHIINLVEMCVCYVDFDDPELTREENENNIIEKYTPREIKRKIKREEWINSESNDRMNKIKNEIIQLNLSTNLYQEFLKITTQRKKEEYKIFIEENRKVLS